jgi:hypothetical protein
VFRKDCVKIGSKDFSIFEDTVLRTLKRKSLRQMSQVLLYKAPIPGCENLFHTPNDASLPRIPRHVKRMPASQLASINAQYHTYKLRHAEYECAKAIHDFEARAEEFPFDPPNPPAFGLPATESMLRYYKSKNTFNPVAPDAPLAHQFRPPRRSVPFRVSSVLPAHLTIPVVSPSLKLNHERAQQRIAAMMIRTDALEGQRKREIAKAVWNAQRRQFLENRSRRGLSQMLTIRDRRKDERTPEEDPGEEVRQMMADIDERDRKMKAERQHAEAIWSGEASAPFLPGDCPV